MNSRLAATIGVLAALWMSLGRLPFGLSGDLLWWYLPGIGLPFALLSLWAARRIRIAQNRGRRTSRSTVVCLILSWICAIFFGLTVPDTVDGELMSLLGWAGGPLWNEMSIALCNPFGIISFALLIGAVAFAAADGREPKPEEDEHLDEHELRMVPHPLHGE